MRKTIIFRAFGGGGAATSPRAQEMSLLLTQLTKLLRQDGVELYVFSSSLLSLILLSLFVFFVCFEVRKPARGGEGMFIDLSLDRLFFLVRCSFSSKDISRHEKCNLPLAQRPTRFSYLDPHLTKKQIKVLPFPPANFC